MHADEPALSLTRSAHLAGLMQKAMLYSKRMSRSASGYVNPCCSGQLTPHDAALHAVQRTWLCKHATRSLVWSKISSCPSKKERCKAAIWPVCDSTSTSADLHPAGCCAYKSTQQVLKNADSCTACWTTTVGNSKYLDQGEPARTPCSVSSLSQDSCLHLL